MNMTHTFSWGYRMIERYRTLVSGFGAETDDFKVLEAPAICTDPEIIITGKSTSGFYFRIIRNDHEEIIHSGHYFLPGKLLNNLSGLALFPEAGFIHMLSSAQKKQAGGILSRLEIEKNSAYAFRIELQQTYVIELIHLLLKNQRDPENVLPN